MKTLRPIETPLVQQELVASVAWLVRIRWMVGTGVLAATWLVNVILRFPLPPVPLYAIGFAILAYNTLIWRVFQNLQRVEPRSIPAFDLLTRTQIALDWLAMTLLIHFSGGLESPVILYFFFHIIIASILLSPRATYWYAAFATILVGANAGLEFAGILPHVQAFDSGSQPFYRQPLYVSAALFFFASALFVAAYLASTLNSRLRKRETEMVALSENLRRAYHRLETLYESAKTITSTLELQQVLDRIVRSAAEAMGVRGCSIRLLDETKSRLIVTSVYGLSQTYLQKGDLILEQNPLARQVLAGKTITIGDIAADTRLQYPAQAMAEGIRSMLSAPLIGKQGALGLIRAYSTEVQHFTADDETFLAAIASEGSIAIENALAFQTLGRLDQIKSKFVLTVTHELRSPVSVVRSLLRTMSAGYTGALTAEQREVLARVQHRADFLQTLIDDLLDLAAGKGDLAVEEQVLVRLDAAAESVVQRFQAPAREKKIALEWHCESGDAPTVILANEDGVDRILNNLVSNAVKYTPTGGRVQVSLRRVGDDAELRVSDSGIGIPENALTHLFEEFYRAPNARAIAKEGTGLGLAITKDLVTRYGGKIAIESKLGDGTTFVVNLPLVQG